MTNAETIGRPIVLFRDSTFVTPTPLLDAIRARAEICVLRSTLSAEMACGVCAANVRCLELDRVCTFIDLVSSSSISMIQ